MRKSAILTAAFAAFLGVTSVASVQGAQGFVRPFAALVSPTTDGYDNEMGYGLTAGAYFGKNNSHEISAEISRAQWDTSESALGLTLTAQETLMPVLLNYRYHFPLSGTKARLYAGPSLGFTNYELDLTARGFGMNLNGSDSAWSFTLSGSAGVIVQLSDKVELDIGYRYMHIDDTEVSIVGVKLETDQIKAHVFYAGLGMKF